MGNNTFKWSRPEWKHEPPVWGEATRRKELFEERAALLQFDGGLTKEEAERQAELEILSSETEVRLRDERVNGFHNRFASGVS